MNNNDFKSHDFTKAINETLSFLEKYSENGNSLVTGLRTHTKMSENFDFQSKNLKISKTNQSRLKLCPQEYYVRRKIFCGLDDCLECDRSQKKYLKVNKSLIIPDLDFLIEAIDIFYFDCPFDNLVILESFVDILREYNFSKFYKLLSVIGKNEKVKLLSRNLMKLFTTSEQTKISSVFCFPDMYFASTTLLDSAVEFKSYKFSDSDYIQSILNVAEFYIMHSLETNVIILCSEKNKKNFDSSQVTANDKIYVFTLKNYIEKFYPNRIDILDKLSLSNLELDTFSARLSESINYTSYFSAAHLQQLSLEKKAFKGKFKAYNGPFSGFLEYDKENEKQQSIYIIGMLNVNRAINGDEVIIQILDESAEFVDNVKEIVDFLAKNIQSKSAQRNKNFSRHSDHKLFDKMLANHSYGRVVSVIKRNTHLCCGTVDEQAIIAYDHENTYLKFVPMNENIPFVLINSSNKASLINRRLAVMIDDWPISSIYPIGHWIDNIGPVGDSETEMKVILRENGICTKKFLPKTLQELPDSDYKISSEEIEKRLDLRLKFCPCDLCNFNLLDVSDNNKQYLGTPYFHELYPKTPLPLHNWKFSQKFEEVWELYVKKPDIEECMLDDTFSGVWTFSIDPPTCTDIDDALSLKYLSNGNFEVGVHIADVSYFIKPDSSLDKEALERALTLYMVKERFDMIPKILSSNICSLLAGKDRLCFSVFWEFDENGKIHKTSFAKTIIHSVAAFSYEQSQSIINDLENNSPYAVRLRVLKHLAEKLKKERLANGALELTTVETKLIFDDQHNTPLNKNITPKNIVKYDTYDTNFLIEEFMLLANISVSKKIYNVFPHQTLLRRHPVPKGSELENLAQSLKNCGIDFKYNTNKQIAESLKYLDKDETSRNVLNTLIIACMNQAEYFCSGSITDYKKMQHYALATEIYTHFTSPIRRYADIIVHRLLGAAIGYEPYNFPKISEIEKLCKDLTQKSTAVKFAQRQAIDFHIQNHIKKKLNETEGKILTTIGSIIKILQTGIFVMINELNIQIFCELPADSWYFDDGMMISKLEQNTKLKFFDIVEISVSFGEINDRVQLFYFFKRKVT